MMKILGKEVSLSNIIETIEDQLNAMSADEREHLGI